MAITQLNTADFDYAMMLNVINKSYKGKADITLSAYDTTAAPDVKVGSVFEDNGAIFIVDTSDITPTGYAGITNSTTFYLYYDESAEVFIYSNTAPTWSDVLQGWYNGNDRAFFSMFKDSGGTLYQNKSILVKTHLLQTKVIRIGDWNMNTTLQVLINHGLSDHTKIRMIDAIIRNDEGSIHVPLVGSHNIGDTTTYLGGFIYNTTATTVSLRRISSGFFDSTDYDSTSYNRGWITIQYEA